MRLAAYNTLSAIVFLGCVAAYAGDGALLLSDDFSTPDPAWGDPNQQMRIENKQMIIDPEVKASYTVLYQGDIFGDADIRVKVAQRSGGTDMPAGIVFWATGYDTYYVAGVTAKGEFGVMRRMGPGRWLTPVGWKVQSVVKPGLNQANELRVVTKGNQATVYVNGSQLASFKGKPPEGGSQLGFHAESGDTEVYSWAFSDFSLRKTE